VYFDIDLKTEVPLFPQPIIPNLIAEFAFDPKATEGASNVSDEIVAVFFINFLRFNDFMDYNLGN
jgi:hypothetical protein